MGSVIVETCSGGGDGGPLRSGSGGYPAPHGEAPSGTTSVSASPGEAYSDGSTETLSAGDSEPAYGGDDLGNALGDISSDIPPPDDTPSDMSLEAGRDGNWGEPEPGASEWEKALDTARDMANDAGDPSQDLGDTDDETGEILPHIHIGGDAGKFQSGGGP